MTTKLSSGRSRIRRSTAALGIAGLIIAGIAGPASATGAEDEGDDSLEEVTQAPVAEFEEDGTDDGEGADDGEDTAPAPAPAFQPLALDPTPGTQVVVDLVGVNDFHGRIDAGLKTDSEGNVTAEGAAVRLAAAVEQARADNSNTFFVGAGDLYSASTFTSMIGNDIPTTDVFNAMGMDASSVGNHEFDRGFQDLQDRIAGNDAFAGKAIQWDYLGANVYHKGTTNPALPEYTILTTSNGIEIAFIGLVTQETPSLVTPAGIANLDFGDPADAVARVIADNPSVSSADAIIVLTHDGGVNGDAVRDVNTHFGQFAQTMAERGDIAGIFSGHTHTTYQVDVPTTMATIDDMPVIQTGSFGDNLGRISLTFDIDSGTTLISAETEMIPLGSVDAPPVGDNPVVDEVRDIVSAAVAAAETAGSQVIGEAGADLLRATHTDPETGNVGENRGGESTISNLIADAQLWAVHEQAATEDLPVIAFMNPGGVRTDIFEGPVTYQQVANVQPFANTLDTFDLTGAQIKQVLEEQWQPDGSSRPFLKLGVNKELTYTYDPHAERGERITQILLGGTPIDPAQTYKVVTNNFLSSGGDNFTTLGQGSNYADSGLIDLDAFVDYFKSRPVVNPDYTQRAVGIYWATGADTEYEAGDEVELWISSLAFSNNEPMPSEVTAVLSGPDSQVFELGSFSVDVSIVNTNDETGQALVKFIIPDGLELPEGVSTWVLNLFDDIGFDVLLDILLTASDVKPDGSGGDGDGGTTTDPLPGDKTDDTLPGTGGDGDGATTTDPLPGDKTGDRLTDTGVDIGGLIALTALLLGVGGAVMTVRRRHSMS